MPNRNLDSQTGLNAPGEITSPLTSFPLMTTLSYLLDAHDPQADLPVAAIGEPVIDYWIRVIKYQVWEQASEETADWMANNPSPSGIPHDPPRNPHLNR